MKGLSTTHYLVSLLDTVYKLLDEPDTWLNLLLIDLQKAFDLVSHSVLVETLLNEFNVPHFLVSIIAYFLSNRSQVVKYKNIYSDSLSISSGVQQGTLLGPLLFLVMINSLTNESANRWKFVDDMSLLNCAEKILRAVQWKFLKTFQVKQPSQK